jgi:NAD(P)-dependent dehydrogenase (short-subunit alcohol dehydrogenase family)
VSTLTDDLRDQVAIITGAGSGIGRATALLAARHGARVAAFDIREQPGQEVVRQIEAEDAEASFHPCDVTRGQDVAQAVRSVLERYGRIDILVNVVGGSRLMPFWELTEKDWDEGLTFNLKSQFLCCRAVVPHMMERRSGAIVNISSGQGATPAPQRAPYSAAKAGVIGLTRTLAAEMFPYRVRVNAVAPSATNSERARSIFTDDEWARHVASQPMGRVGEPEDMAETIVFLASPRARHINGQVFFVNGGSFMP